MYMYLLVFTSLIIAVFLIIAYVYICTFLQFSQNLTYIILLISILIGSYFIMNKIISISSSKLMFVINVKSFKVNKIEISFADIVSIKLSSVLFNNFPRLVIVTKNKEVYRYRFDKTEGDFWDFDREMRKFIKEFDFNNSKK